MPKMNDSELKQEPILLEERYLGRLKEVKQYTKEYKTGPTEKLAWIFEVLASEEDLDPDVEYETDFTGVIEVACHTSLATGERSGFNQKGFWKLVGDDWDYDTDPLVGLEAMLDVDSYFDDKAGIHRNGIEKVRPKTNKKGRSKAAAEAQADNSDEEATKAAAQAANDEDFAELEV